MGSVEEQQLRTGPAFDQSHPQRVPQLHAAQQPLAAQRLHAQLRSLRGRVLLVLVAVGLCSHPKLADQ